WGFVTFKGARFGRTGKDVRYLAKVCDKRKLESDDQSEEDTQRKRGKHDSVTILDPATVSTPVAVTVAGLSVVIIKDGLERIKYPRL
ncbi:hypothetical protein HK100_007412, partial [Physocladia obscura]